MPLIKEKILFGESESINMLFMVSGFLIKHQEALQGRAGARGLHDQLRGSKAQHQQLGGESDTR